MARARASVRACGEAKECEDCNSVRLHQCSSAAAAIFEEFTRAISVKPYSRGTWQAVAFERLCMISARLLRLRMLWVCLAQTVVRPPCTTIQCQCLAQHRSLCKAVPGLNFS